MGRNIVFAPDEYYHLYNRGTEKRNIYSTKSDYERFLVLLYVSNNTLPIHLDRQGRTLQELEEVDRKDTFVDIGAYCLMPNHFHILVRAKNDDGVSRFMQKLSTGYTMYFNKKHERTGALFQGKFKATHADKDKYLKYLLAYIHLNPVKIIDPEWKDKGIRNQKHAQEYLEKYKYSSYLDYAGHERLEKKILSIENFPEYFETLTDFKTNTKEFLNYKI